MPEPARRPARTLKYFAASRARMNYPKFRQMGLCVASGVIEGACKRIVAARLKQGGKRWTVNGAHAIIAPRC